MDEHGEHDQRQTPCPVATPSGRVNHDGCENSVRNSHRDHHQSFTRLRRRIVPNGYEQLCCTTTHGAVRESCPFINALLLRVSRACRRLLELLLLAGVVVALGLLQHFYVSWRQLRTVNRQRQLVELAGEGERNLIVLVVHRSASVGADIKVLVPLQDQRQGVLHRLRGHRLAVHLQDARTAAADAAHVVEGERSHAEAVVLEVEFQRVLAGRKHFRSLPLHAFKVDQVPREYWFALQHVEAVPAEAATLGDDYALDRKSTRL